MINKKKVFVSTLLLGVCSSALIAVETPSGAVMAKELTPAVRDSVSRHTVGYLQKEADADALVKAGHEFFDQEKYFDARDKYIAAKKILNTLNPDAFREKIKFCTERIEKCYYQIALQAMAKADQSEAINDYDEAISLCKEAAEAYPACKDEMEKRVKRYTEFRQTKAIQNDTSTDALLPDKETEEYEISVALRRAREYVNAGLYDKAKRVYENILIKNPYRSDVLKDLEAVNTYINASGVRRRLNSRRAAITANELEWALPIQRPVQKTVEILDTPVDKKVEEESNLAAAIKGIIIPRISFEDVNLRNALKLLTTYSVRNDPAGVGINIFLRQVYDAPAASESAEGMAAAPAAAPQQDLMPGNPEEMPEEEPEETVVAEEEDVADEDDESNWTELEKTPLSLGTLTDKSLEDIIRSICINAKLRYRIEKHAVVIEPLSLPDTALLTKIFPVDQNAISSVATPDDNESIKSFFINQGIAFPSGSKVVYDARLSRLFATNTIENLNKIEEECEKSLSAGADSDTLVQIQLRIVEISQKDLNALGFNYTLKDNSVTDKVFESMSTTNQLRDIGTLGPNAHADFKMGEFSLGVDVKALDDLTSKDVLASPRVTTLPGEKVDIKLVTTMYFAEDFEESETQTNQAENGDLTYTYVGPFPNFEDEPEELGISFSTTPTIGENGEITMLLAPNISSLVGWTEYEGTNEEGALETTRVPNIAKRKLSTTVTVKDGETLVLGGVIEDNVVTRKDKVPLLGDIPLLGRLFQSRSRTSEKKNLLIFVTPRLVKPNGTFLYPENHQTQRGIARFL